MSKQGSSTAVFTLRSGQRHGLIFAKRSRRCSSPVRHSGCNYLRLCQLFNVELKDDEGFIGDRASKGAFRQIIENWRVELRKLGADPFGEDASEELTKKRLDDILARGGTEAAGIIHGANRGVLAGTRLGDPAFPEIERMEGHGAVRHRGRVPRKPRR